MLITQRLIIREIEFTDQEDYLEIFSDPELARFDDYEIIIRDDLEEIFQKYKNKEREFLSRREYAVVLKELQKMIGLITITHQQEIQWIGYHFHREYHGQGYALESVQAFLKRAKKPFQANVDIRNHRSIKLLQKCNFQRINEIINDKGIKEHIYTWNPHSTF